MSNIIATAYDAIGSNVNEIPLDAEVVFGYADGSESQWDAQQIARWRSMARFALITTTNQPHAARIADIERGDLTPADAPDFIKARNAFSGEHDATLYCNLSSLPDVVREADKAGEPYWLWVADWTGEPRGGYSLHTGHGTICAQQYKTVPGKYDVTAIYSPVWLGMLSKPSGRAAHDESMLMATAADEPTEHPPVEDISLPTRPAGKADNEVDGYVMYINPLGGFSGRAVTSLDNGKTWQ